MRQLHRLAAATSIALPLLLASVAGAGAAGPPYPEPVVNQAVYDTAGVFRDSTIQRAEQLIDGIEARTGAEVVVYTQLVPDGRTTAQADADAQALMDQWGVGRKGIDDGLVILFDLNESDPCHGQVQLYAGPGYAASYLSNGERQALFEEQMLPLLRRCDLDGALLVAMDAIDANATPAHAAQISFFRQLNAVLGLVIAPLVFVLIMAWGILTWFRSGRDPVYLDDPSIHLPAPPPGLTPAAGAAVRDGKASRRALTAASLDLAVRGHIAFDVEEERGLLTSSTDVGIRIGDAVAGDPVQEAHMTRARNRPMDPGSQLLLGRLRAMGGGTGYVDSTEILDFGKDVPLFERRLEDYCVSQGWMRERPSRTRGRWVGRGVLAFVVGVIALVAGFNLPSDGLVLLGGALVAAGIGLFVLSGVMPSVTREGSMVRAMLAAYRRTLEKTMAQARSMDEVVTASAIPLIESPDDAVAWGVALGLQDDVQRVLERTAEDAQQGRGIGYTPAWYGTGGGTWWAGGGSGGGGLAPGLMSASAIPNFGAMMGAISTIGNSPPSSGSGSGGGGFSGGGSGGGGGGAGGGF